LKSPAADPPADARTFILQYGVEVTGLPPGGLARIWVPVPPANREQDVAIVQAKNGAFTYVGR